MKIWNGVTILKTKYIDLQFYDISEQIIEKSENKQIIINQLFSTQKNENLSENGIVLETYFDDYDFSHRIFLLVVNEKIRLHIDLYGSFYS